MANKTLILKGLTNNTGTDGALDITEKVLGVNPAVATPVVTKQFYSTIASTVVEGVGKYLVDRKAHVKELANTAAIHGATATPGATVGALTTANFKEHKRDAFTFTLDKSWDTGFVYDKRKDPKVREGELISDLGSLLEDVEENKAAAFWDAINTDIAGTKSAKFATYPSSLDASATAAPDLKKSIPVADKDKGEVWVDAIFNLVSEQALMGRKNSTHEFYPYARGTRAKLAAKIVIKENMIPVISKDERFIQTGLSEEMIKRGVVAMVNNVEVFKDEMFDTTVADAIKVALIPTGKYSPAIVAEELPGEFMLFNHPTKPTRAQLLEGAGAFDTAVTPYINLARFITQATVK